MFRQKLKKAAATMTILILLPFVLTVFLSGGKGNEKEDILDTYCIGVLSQEVIEDYEDEMLKAQAVIVRTTVHKEMQENGKKIDSEKAYEMKNEISADWYRRLKEIWDETEGQVLMYEDELALTPFHYLSSGATRDGKKVLGSDAYPYLESVSCPKDVESEEQINSFLIPVKKADIKEKDKSGYVTVVQVGEELVTGEQFRSAYGLASSCFTFQKAEEKTRVITKGIGHGLGLSQYTANEMAKEGKTYEEILFYFFKDTKLKEV